MGDFRSKKVDVTKYDSTVGKAKEEEFYEMKLQRMPRSLNKRFRALRDKKRTPETCFNRYVARLIQEDLTRLEELDKRLS